VAFPHALFPLPVSGFLSRDTSPERAGKVLFTFGASKA
jgi:hypothetical protein